MATKIYTRTGDAGETSLFGGARLPKHHIRINAYGTVDELNAHIGYLHELINDDEVRVALTVIQNDLFDIGAVLATDPGKSGKLRMACVDDSDISRLERLIDRMDAELPELKAFILPSGHPHGAFAHIVRTVCRRAERAVTALSAETDDVPAIIVIYLNRLSDYCFTLARHLTYSAGGSEVQWHRRKS